MSTINELKWQSMTAAVNEMKSPNQAIKRLMFRQHQTLPTETIELSVINNARTVAPFVRKNGEAVLVSGTSHAFQTVEAPNIRMKMPFTPSELLYGRQPGTVIFSPGASYQLSALRRHVARDLQAMADLATNAEEYLACLALQGVITYSNSPLEVFQITFPKPAGNTITLTTFWDDADPDLPVPFTDVLTAKRVAHNAVNLPVTHAILGAEASAAFCKLVERGKIKLLDMRSVNAGAFEATGDFTQDGMIYLGNFAGIQWWEYSRTVSVNGTTTNLIRSKYVEFVCAVPAAENVLYYGAIPDMKALQGRLFQAERFSKSWEIEEPSALMALLATRPLPVPRRPGSIVSMKVVSG